MPVILLLANKDSSIVRTIPKFLNACEHREVEGGKLHVCMNSLMKVKETLGPYMITNMNRIVKQRISTAISRVQKLFNVNVIALVEDGVKIHVRKGIYFSAYVLNISSIEMMNSLWETAIAAAPPIVRRKRPPPPSTTKKKKTIVIRSSSPPPKEDKSSPLPLPPPASSDDVFQWGLELMDTDEIWKEIEDGNFVDNLYQDSGSTTDGMLDKNAFLDDLENFDPEEEFLKAAAAADDH